MSGRLAPAAAGCLSACRRSSAARFHDRHRAARRRLQWNRPHRWPPPMQFRREALRAKGILAARDLQQKPDGTWVRSAGCVIARQRTMPMSHRDRRPAALPIRLHRSPRCAHSQLALPRRCGDGRPAQNHLHRKPTTLIQRRLGQLPSVASTQTLHKRSNQAFVSCWIKNLRESLSSSRRSVRGEHHLRWQYCLCRPSEK